MLVTPRNAARQLGVAEFVVSGMPAAPNPYDPDQIVLRATFTAPSGLATTVDGFWYQNYRNALSGGFETLTAQGPAEWRVRFMPAETGPYQIALQAVTPSSTNTGTFNFEAAAASGSNVLNGVVQVSTNRQYFELAGQPLPLNGANVCWHGNRGTFDYLDWFPAMKNAGENFARLWMCPWAFGIEAEAGTRTNYNQRRAWQLDQAMRIAQTNNIWLMLCLDYHGMYQTVVDQFGGNDGWKNNPYNTANGGPCPAPNDYFTNAAARDIYKKRLRYVIARWGASPNLLCWELFNEIDNDYNVLDPTAVANWHSAIAPWLRQNDPYARLVTTSLTGSSDRAEIWNIASLDFAQYHSYGLAQPAARLAPIVQGMIAHYHKPVLVGEYGIDASGFHAEKDPYFRGLRQGIWSGLLSGAPGTSMSWWWEEIQARNLYPNYAAVSQYLKKTALGEGSWSAIRFLTNGDPPATVGEALTNAAPFNATLNLNGQWGFSSPGALAVPNLDGAGRAAGVLGAFIHGSSHSELRIPCKISAWFSTNAHIVLHVNSVSDGAVMNVRLDGSTTIASVGIPNKDGKYDVNNEYNVDYTYNIPAGKHLIEVRNTGADWYYLDWIRLENVQPSAYQSGWTESPVAIGLRSPAESLLYVVNPAANFPANALATQIPPLTNAAIRLTNWPAGSFTAIWHNAKNLQPLGKTSGATTNNVLQLPLPAFFEDIAGRIVSSNSVSVHLGTNGLAIDWEFPAPAHTTLETTPDLSSSWQPVASILFGAQQTILPAGAAGAFFRLITQE